MPLLQIDIEARYAKFQDALKAMERQTSATAARMGKSFDGVKGALAGLGAGISVGALVGIIKEAIDAADHLNDLSKQTGIAVDTLGGLGFAAGQAGGDLESIADAAGKLNKSIAGAAGGNKEFADAFKALGINIKDAEGKLKSVDQVMIELADKFESYADGPEKVAIATRLLGKSGAAQIALLNDGGRALQQNIEYYKRYAGVTQDTADKADAFNDTLGKLSLLSGSFGRTLAAELLPTLQGVANALLTAKENGDQFSGFAVRGAEAIRLLAVAAAAGLSGLNDVAIKAGLAGRVLKDLATLSPGKISGDWKQYNEAVEKSAEAFGNLHKNLTDPPPPDKFEAIVGKRDGEIKGEQDLLATRNQFLQKYNNEALLSDKDYYKAKEDALKESNENTKKLYDQQIAALMAKKQLILDGVIEKGDPVEIQGRIDDLYKKKALIGTSKPRAPVLPSGTPAPDGAFKELEGELKGLERMSERERQILASRTEFLQAYYQEDLISISRYYSALRTSQEEALREQEANIDKEIAGLKRFKPKDENQAAEVNNRVEALQDKKAALQVDAGRAAIRLSLEEARAAKAFQDTLAGINADLLEQRGLLAEAAGARFDLSNEKIKKQLTTKRDEAESQGDVGEAAARNADLARLATLRELVVAQAKLNSINEVGDRIQFDLFEATERAQLAAQTGAAGELESLRMVSDARLQAAADLQQVATAFDAVAHASADPKMIQQARALQLEVDKLAASADLVREKFQGAFEGGFNSFFDRIISGTVSIKDAFKSLFADIAADLSKIAIKDLGVKLFSKDGALGGIVDTASSLFGGASKVPTASADVGASLVKRLGGAPDLAAVAASAAAAATQVTAFTAATTGANGVMSTLAVTSLPSLVVAADAAAAALARISATGSGAGASGLFGLFGGGDVGSSASYADLDLLASANGNIFAGGNVIPFAKGGIPGVVSAPTFFPMKNGDTGVMGEAGPEAIMPLVRDKGGELAVRMVGDRGNVTLLPLVRDSQGRMAVRSAAKAFADGGVFGAGASVKRFAAGAVIESRSSQVIGFNSEMVTNAVPMEQPSGGDVINIHIDAPPGTTRESADQMANRTAVALSRARRRNS
jgi:hypothetical protein